MAEFNGVGFQVPAESDGSQKERLFAFLVIGQNAAKVKKRHGYKAVAEKKVFEMDKGEDADKGVC